MEIQQGRGVWPIKPLLFWEMKAGVTLTLPVELEAILIREDVVVGQNVSMLSLSERLLWPYSALTVE